MKLLNSRRTQTLPLRTPPNKFEGATLWKSGNEFEVATLWKSGNKFEGATLVKTR